MPSRISHWWPPHEENTLRCADFASLRVVISCRAGMPGGATSKPGVAGANSAGRESILPKIVPANAATQQDVATECHVTITVVADKATRVIV